MSEKERLLSKSISENSVQPDPNNKNYTVPRSFGVYEIQTTTNAKRFGFGNYPVRENELIRDFKTARKIGLFFDRNDAKNLANLLNA